MKAALLMSHGFNDWNVMPEHSYRIYDAARAKGLPVQIYYHQNGHGGPPPVRMMNLWFTRYLHGVENGVEKLPKAYIVRENADKSEPTVYPDYPNPEAKMVKLHLAPGAPKSGKLELKQPAAGGSETLTDNFNFSGASLAQAETSPNRLLYLTPLLKEDLHISGLAKITIRLASSKPAANLSVWLVALPWNTDPKAKITDDIITRSWADPQNHESLRHSKPLVPGKFYTLSFDLQPDDQVIPKGQQIGLMIFSSDREFTLWPDPGTELTVDLNSTFLHLPVVGGEAGYQKAINQK
jgi:X-Pro dipeptidyl-peptidase